MDRKPVVVDESPEIMDPSKIMGDIYIKEEIIIPDDLPEEGFEVEEEEEPEEGDYQMTEGDGGGVLNDEPTDLEEGEPDPKSEQEVMFDHFEAWRKWKKLKRKLPNRKNVQVYEIYRDENYFVTDRYTDDEEFVYKE